MMYLLKKSWLLLLVVVLYFGVGLYNNNFYRTLIQTRANTARKNPGRLHVAVVHADAIPSGFLTGAELAAEDVNKKIPGRLTLLEVESASDVAARLDSLLCRDLTISIVVAEAPTLSNKIAVICESYGVGLLLLNPDPTFLTSQGFKYVAKVGPQYSAYCQAVIDHLGLLSGKPAQAEIRVGLFFDQSALGGEELVNTYLGVNRAHNELYMSSVAIQKAVDEGLLEGGNRLGSVDDTLYLQTGVSVAGSVLKDYVQSETHSPSSDLTIQQALDRTPVLKNPVKLSFVQGYESEPFNPGQLAAVTKSEPLDCILLIASLPKTTELLGRLRSLKVTTPIVCLDCQPAPWVTANMGRLAEGLYLVNSVDPSQRTEALDEFRRRFREREAKLDRVVNQVDRASILAYESLTTLADLVEKQGSTVPLDLMTLLQLGDAKWQWLSAEKVGFNPVDDGAERKPVLVTLKDGIYVTLK